MLLISTGKTWSMTTILALTAMKVYQTTSTRKISHKFKWKKSSPIIYATFYITTKSRFTKIFIPYPTFSNHLYLLSFIIFGIFFNNCPYIEAFNWNFPTSLTCTFLQSPNYKVLELFVKHQLINWYLERSKIVYYFASRKAPLIRLKIIFRKKGKIKVIE